MQSIFPTRAEKSKQWGFQGQSRSAIKVKCKLLLSAELLSRVEQSAESSTRHEELQFQFLIASDRTHQRFQKERTNNKMPVPKKSEAEAEANVLKSRYKSVPIASTAKNVAEFLLQRAADQARLGRTKWMVSREIGRAHV